MAPFLGVTLCAVWLRPLGIELAPSTAMPEVPAKTEAPAAVPETQVVPAAPTAPSSEIPPAPPDHREPTRAEPALARKKAPKSKTPVWIIVVLGLALAAGAGIHFHSRSEAPTSEAAVRSESESTLVLDTFVVNLEGGNKRAYLRIGITIGLSRPLAHKKDDVPIASLRDAILSVLSSAQADQLLSSEGKQKLKEDLLKALRARSPELGIDNVYFTEFLVQM